MTCFIFAVTRNKHKTKIVACMRFAMNCVSSICWRYIQLIEIKWKFNLKHSIKIENICVETDTYDTSYRLFWLFFQLLQTYLLIFCYLSMPSYNQFENGIADSAHSLLTGESTEKYLCLVNVDDDRCFIKISYY